MRTTQEVSWRNGWRRGVGARFIVPLHSGAWHRCGVSPGAVLDDGTNGGARAMVELRDKQILVGAEPWIVMAGEIHYFRLARGDWQDRLDKLKAVGGNTVAAYIPWLWHELPDGTLDLDGRTRPERDLGAFVDLCRDNGLWFFARP